MNKKFIAHPKWIKEISRFNKVKNGFILYGNIYDVFAYETEENVVTLPIDKYLTKFLTEEESYEQVIKYEPLFGFTGLNKEYEKKDITLSSAYTTIDTLLTEETGSCIIVDFTSRLQDIAGRDLNEFLYKIFRLSYKLTPKMIDGIPKHNLLVFLVDKENDMPAWFTLDNLNLKSIAIAKPDEREREIISKNVLKMFKDYATLREEKQEEVSSFFVTQTSGMFAREIVSIVTLALREGLDATEISEAIRRYKVGISENPWAKINKERLKNANEIIGQRVIGQEKSVKKAVRSIKRAFFNLSGAQYSRYSNRPKGVLFLAGATGVGKTELAKSVTELLFGSESNYIRFDMSEFSHEHADQRLIGAPPGYVGYDVGGELINKIKQNPFSVVLFDEIEKAHPKILDIFLQILDDGRLTSGRGEVVYFSESIIIFTSNLGIYKEEGGKRVLNVSSEEEYPVVERKVKTSIEEYFKFTINRPEILNRIGENIVVFDFIRKNNAAKIFEKMLNNIVLKLEDDYKIKLLIDAAVKEAVKEEVIKELNMGGRGIGNQLEEVFVNPLADLLFELMPTEGDSVTIHSIDKNETEWIMTGSL